MWRYWFLGAPRPRINSEQEQQPWPVEEHGNLEFRFPRDEVSVVPPTEVLVEGEGIHPEGWGGRGQASVTGWMEISYSREVQGLLLLTLFLYFPCKWQPPSPWRSHSPKGKLAIRATRYDQGKGTLVARTVTFSPESFFRMMYLPSSAEKYSRRLLRDVCPLGIALSCGNCAQYPVTSKGVAWPVIPDWYGDTKAQALCLNLDNFERLFQLQSSLWVWLRCHL